MVPQRLALASVLAVLWVAPTLGRADPARPIDAGLWSLELGVQPLSSYGTGLGLAAKYHVSDRSAIRLGLTGSIYGSDGSRTVTEGQEIPGDSTVATAREEDSTDRRDVTVFAHWVRYAALEQHFGMTLEAGPTVHWASAEYVNRYGLPFPSVPPDQHRDFAEDENIWEYGLDLQAGFEWFFSRNVSIAGRFGVALLRTEDRRTQDEILTSNDLNYTHGWYSESQSDGFALRTMSPLISMNAYW